MLGSCTLKKQGGCTHMVECEHCESEVPKVTITSNGYALCDECINGISV